ncbi:MAG TPA: hypothetical protein VL688_13200 [Verrucomicrobiae bacterium]|jgi:hypothetical protein|nr:hypothetical protein [Verrucomicrobiae bacterium]
MDDQEFITKFKAIPSQELRSATEHFVEAVYNKDVLKKSVIPLIEKSFGAPLKPAGAAPSSEASLRAAAYGGIRKDQTLYYRTGEGPLNTIMFWPWSDGQTFTVKIYRS